MLSILILLLLKGLIKCENSTTATTTLLIETTTTVISSTKTTVTTENGKTSDRSFINATSKGYCGSPDVANGTFFVIGGVNVTENRTYVDGTVATYKCINLHDRLINATDSKNQYYLRYCVTKNWTGRAPLCEVTCQPVVVNDALEHLHDVIYDTLPLSGGRYIIGTKATFSCDFNITLPDVNHASIVCQPNGTWSASYPTCGFYEEVAPIRLTLFAIGVIVVCTLALLIFIVGWLVICQRANKGNPIIRRNAKITDNEAQRTTVPYGGFYSFQEAPPADGERVYATIHRSGKRVNSRNNPFVPMSVSYNKIN